MLPLVAEIIGKAFTVIVATARFVLMHPLDAIPITVYEVFVSGDTTGLPLE